MKKSIVIPALFLLKASLIVSCNYSPKVTAKQKTSKSKPVVIDKNNSQKATWTGSWERRVWQDDCTLYIESVKGDSLKFTLNAADGGHSGEIEGNAYVKNNEAVFESAEDKGCKLTFRLKGNSIIVDDQNSCGGLGVTFSGKFVNAKKLLKETKQSLASLDILTPQQDLVFRILVDTSYKHFVDCTELIADRTGEKYLDNFEAKVISSGVRGLYTYMEYVIMVDKKNIFWAAIITGEKVLYYTNSKNYTDKLPHTIEDWRSRFSSYPVIFIAKNK
jgi:hypothetical protein